MTCIDYNKESMRFVLYDNGEIEIVEETENNKKWLFHFRSIYDLADAIKKAKPELAKQLIEHLKEE